MPEIRIKPGIPCKGVSLPRAFVSSEWVTVDDETADYARTLRLHATNPNSQLVFEERQPEATKPEPAKVEAGEASAADGATETEQPKAEDSKEEAKVEKPKAASKNGGSRQPEATKPEPAKVEAGSDVAARSAERGERGGDGCSRGRRNE
jgi:hypothetical protein